MPLVFQGSDQVILGSQDVIQGDDPTPPPAVGFEVYRNGVLEDILWSRSQLLSMTFGISAYDGEIGTGSIVVPGAPDQGSGWWIGDRISFVDPDSTKILYTGYIMSPKVSINPDSLTELETTWSLMDMNRQFIGRRVNDFTENGPFDVDVLFAHIKDQIEGAGAPNPTIDDTWVVADATQVPTTEYNSDGAMDWITQIIQYTGKTVYLSLSDTENEFELHIHDLMAGPSATINIDDRAGYAGGDTFAPSLNATFSYDTTDLKDGVTGRNGVTSVPSGVAGTYGNGGIGWEATVDYGSLDEDSLVLATNNLILLGSVPKQSFSATIFHLTGAQVAGIRAGSTVPVVTSLGIITLVARVSRETLTVTRDISGNPLRGYWDIALEIGYPLRGPTAVVGFGGQGNVLGALGTFVQWTHTRVTEDDPALELGDSETVTAQLLDDHDIATPVPNVSLEWTVVLGSDGTTPHPDYIVLVSPTSTDQSGQALATVVRTGDSDPTSDHMVKADPV